MQGHPRDHHYIPQFYLERWTGADGKLCEMRRFEQVGIIAPHRKPPKGTGYKRDLYSVNLGPGENHQLFETTFLKKVDQEANDLFADIDTKGRVINSTSEKSILSRFIMSVLLRDPETIEQIRSRVEADYPEIVAKSQEAYNDFRANYDGPPLPADVEDYYFLIDPFFVPKMIVRTMKALMDNATAGTVINRMFWCMIEMAPGSFQLLTCDHPLLVCEQGIIRDYAYIAFPFSPTKLAIGVNNRKYLDRVFDRSCDDIVRMINQDVCAQAKQYVYGVNDAALPFVRKWMGTRQSPTVQQMVRDTIRLRLDRYLPPEQTREEAVNNFRVLTQAAAT